MFGAVYLFVSSNAPGIAPDRDEDATAVTTKSITPESGGYFVCRGSRGHMVRKSVHDHASNACDAAELARTQVN